ncbi:GNAT family N-acetyltransferase, partial [Modestobacter roseus]|uniref:GNAT family N-acetyltransferase n=1 Tax=Modestobacter roseus TaxID=1181884 RepID=UPI0034DE6758
DWPAVEAIWAAGIATGLATFETSPPSWAEFDASRLPGHRHVAVDGDELLGWTACTRESTRDAYAGVVEHSVYVSPAAQGRGVGGALLQALVDSTEAAGIWTIRAGILPANAASVALHQKHGFRVVGTREKVGRRVVDGVAGWHDVLLMERRSRVVGWPG